MFAASARSRQDLGLKLFERHRSGYASTPAGEEMVAVAERLDEDVTAFARRLAGQEITPAGELRVTTNDTLLIHLLTPIFARFREQCPDIRLDIWSSATARSISLSAMPMWRSGRPISHPTIWSAAASPASPGRFTVWPSDFPNGRRGSDTLMQDLGFAGRQFGHLKAVKFAA